MHVRPMQPIRVVPRLLVVGAFHADERPEVRGVRIGQLQNDAPPNGTTNQCRLFELERLAKSQDGFYVELGSELVRGFLPTFRRIRLTVPWHVERNHPEAIGDFRIVQHMAVLPAVGAGCVQTDQRYSRPGFLEVDATGFACNIHIQVAPHDRFIPRAHGFTSVRGDASRSLTNCRCAIKGCKLPSICMRPWRVSAKISCQPAAGVASQKRCHVLASAESAKSQGVSGRSAAKLSADSTRPLRTLTNRSVPPMPTLISKVAGRRRWNLATAFRKRSTVNRSSSWLANGAAMESPWRSIQ